MFEQTFKNIDDILYKDAGADSELDYIGQTSWILFLRYLNELELDKKEKAELKGQQYEFILEEEYRWANWAMPKTADGKLDHHKAMTGNDLVQFVDGKLFLYLSKFKEKADNPKTIEYKIGIHLLKSNDISKNYILSVRNPNLLFFFRLKNIEFIYNRIKRNITFNRTLYVI
jgi:type I restriction enzyme M protein